jgi:hypothetical protein
MKRTVQSVRQRRASIVKSQKCVLPCPILSYLLLSCLVLSCPILSCGRLPLRPSRVRLASLPPLYQATHRASFPFPSQKCCPVLPCLVLSSLVLSCPVMSCGRLPLCLSRVCLASLTPLYQATHRASFPFPSQKCCWVLPCLVLSSVLSCLVLSCLVVDFHYVPHVFVLPSSPHSIRQRMSDNNDETLTSEEEEKLRGLFESRRRLGRHMNVLVFQARFERNRWTAVKRACGQR